MTGKRYEVRVKGADVPALRREIDALEENRRVTVEVEEEAFFAPTPEIFEFVIHTVEAVKDHVIALAIVEWLKGLKKKTKAKSVEWDETEEDET